MTKLHCMKCGKDFDNELDTWYCPHDRKNTLKHDDVKKKPRTPLQEWEDGWS